MKTKTGRDGFTLIELLVVISIIAILAGILLPTISRSMQKAEKTQAISDVGSLVTAVKAYYADYGRYPFDNGRSSDTHCGESGTSNRELMNVLRGIDGAGNSGHENNIRKISYLDLSEQRLDVNGNFVDPWDQQYGVSFDTGFNNTVNNIPGFSDADGQNVVAWSLGVPDRDEPIKSWEE